MFTSSLAVQTVNNAKAAEGLRQMEAALRAGGWKETVVERKGQKLRYSEWTHPDHAYRGPLVTGDAYDLMKGITRRRW